MSKDEIFSTLKKILIDDFEIEESLISPDALIADDLDMDSIDAVEMIVKMKPYMSKKIEPEAFKSVRTIQDVVDIIEPLVN